jgi:hypothetical protein
MDHATRRPLLTAATLATVGALALTPVAVSTHEVHLPSISPTIVSSQAVALADAWSDLLNQTANSLGTLASIYVGQGVPLPDPTIVVAPILTQLVLNQLIYAGQLFSGQGAQIPGEIATHLNRVATVIGEVASELPPVIVSQVQTPIVAIQEALASISTATNPLIGLIEAPAVFLNIALNGDYGLLGSEGPIAVGIVIRNALATAIDPPLPAWLSNILQPKVPGAAALTPKTVALKVAGPARTASSARPASKAPKAPSSSRKAAAKSSTKGGGAGHSKRG